MVTLSICCGFLGGVIVGAVGVMTVAYSMRKK